MSKIYLKPVTVFGNLVSGSSWSENVINSFKLVFRWLISHYVPKTSFTFLNWLDQLVAGIEDGLSNDNDQFGTTNGHLRLITNQLLSSRRPSSLIWILQ